MIKKLKIKLAQWYEQNHPYLLIFYPLAILYKGLIFLRKTAYQLGIFNSYHCPVPLIVVGNITLGGSGKTPIVIALANVLTHQGFKVGIISRGYQAQTKNFPLEVTLQHNAADAGDEPLLIKKHTALPVVIDPKRTRAALFLLQKYPNTEIILSDDGLQHYALGRTLEIIVLNASFFNTKHRLFPSGDLREPLNRLNKADFILQYEDFSNQKNLLITNDNFYKIAIQPECFINLLTLETKDISFFQNQEVNSACGIAHPERFFDTLKNLNIIQLKKFIYPDHQNIEIEEIHLDPSIPLIITEKDAVKINTTHHKNVWFLRINVQLPLELITKIKRDI